MGRNEWPEEIFCRINDTVRIRICMRPAQGKPIEYHVGLEIETGVMEEEWEVIYSFDNEHGFHHSHRHHPNGEQKEQGGPFLVSNVSAAEAIGIAKEYLRKHWREERQRYQREMCKASVS